MSLWQHFPSGVRKFLLRQPLPDAWLISLREAEHQHHRPEESALPREDENTQPSRPHATFEWKQAHRNGLVLLVLLLSALIMYRIVR